MSIPLLSGTTCSAQLKDSIYAYIQACGIQHPDVVMQQALLETGHLKSGYLMERNNIFAFRVTKEYMRFTDWKACVKYYKRWQEKHYTNTKENYYSFLKRIGYSGTHNYTDVLKRVRIKKT